MILAVAGRRIDAVEAKSMRFPVENIEQVNRAVGVLLKDNKVTTVVSSAACGADLIVLAEAGKLNLRRRVVLPFNRQEFREKSVTDRPGEWGALYDNILDDVSAEGNLVVLTNLGESDPFIAANERILDEATALGREEHEPISAAIFWDGTERGEPDYTAEFAKDARRRSLVVIEVPTL
jgi:hypothetical protein